MYAPQKVRVFYCGEYGDKLGRPHYHAVLFNFDFKDKVYWRTVNDCKYYTSPSLSELWPFGHSTIGAVTFESAAYVARYTTKKITGKDAEAHYKKVDADTGEIVKVLPEFCGMSLKPGIGKPWLDKYGKTDVFPYDECVARGARCKPPRS